jgi:hypothetical protein
MNATIGMGIVLEGGPDADAEELDSLTRRLRDRLLELDVDDVRPAPAARAVPDGAKSGELIVAGGLAVTLAPVLVRAVLRLVETWMTNRPLRTVTVTVDGRSIELGHATREEQRRLVDAFVAATQAQAPVPEGGDGSQAPPDPGSGQDPEGRAGPGEGDGGDGR